MWTTLPLVAALALAPAQAPTQPKPAEPAAGGLNLTNVRNTYGELGGTRADTSFLPGDVLFVAFDIEGITIDPAGRTKYTMAMEVVDKDGKTIFKNDPAEKSDFAPLGGTKLPARAFVTVGLEQPPGQYTLKVTVTDLANKASKTLERKFEVKPKDFGVVAVYTSADPQGQYPAPTTGVVSQSVWVQFGVVGFARDPKTKQPNVTVEMLTVDEQGKPTVPQPNVYTQDTGIDPKDQGFTLRFLLPMTRDGKFTVRLKAADKVSGKTASFDLPVAVVKPAN
jgi:hypothetical protein